MNVPKVNMNVKHIKWCRDFIAEQAKSASMVRKMFKKSSIYNPFSSHRNIDSILKRYEKSFW